MWREQPGIEVRSAPGVAIVLALTGDHDLGTKPMLVAALGELEPDVAVVIDLRRCTFIDSTVIGAILSARRSDAPRLCVVPPPDTSYVMRALSVVGMRDLVPMHPSVEAALASLGDVRHG